MDERPLLGLTLGEAMLRGAAIAAVLIAALVGLYLLKNKTGSQGWRVRVPRGVQRMFTFMVWLVAKKVPWKPILIWGPWVAMIGGAAFYGIENWRGKKAWERTRAELVARDDTVDFEDFGPPEIPDEENFLKHPAVLAELRGTPALRVESLGRMGLVDLAARRIVLDGAGRGARTDVREWLEPPHPGSEREAAVELLAKYAPLEAQMAGIAEAARRPDCSERWVRYGTNPAMWDLHPSVFTILRLPQAFAERAVLRLRTGDHDGAVTDFETGLHLVEHVARGPMAFDFHLTVGYMHQAEKAFWELVPAPGVDLDRLSEALEFLRSYDPRTAYLDAMKAERAWILTVLGHGSKDRKELAEALGRFGPGIDLTPDWAPDWIEEGQDFVNEWIFRLGPRGWFGLWKEDYCQYLDRALFQPDGVDLERIHGGALEIARRAREEADESRLAELLRFGYDIESGAERALYGHTRIELMLTALELERFRRANGEYPATLKELVPTYLPKLPLDVMTDEPLIYRVKADGTPLLYSVGANRIDDGGVPARNPADLDWVWQLTPTPGQSESEWSRGEKP